MFTTPRHSPPVQIGLCDVQPVMAEGVRAILRGDPQLEWRWNAFSMDQLRRAQAEDPAEVLLVDRAFGSLAVIDWLNSFNHDPERPKVAVWSTVMSVLEAERFVCAGASGVLMRTAAPLEVLDCLHRLAEGGLWAHPSLFPHGMARAQRREPGLTSREQEVCELVRRGFSNRQVAADLGISPGTVKIHLQHIFSKAGVRDRSALVAAAATLLSGRSPETVEFSPPPFTAPRADARFALAKA
ncbi:MAG: LuxR C-terminal-related transcriptional regulator [Bryobacteraceae bacterium]